MNHSVLISSLPQHYVQGCDPAKQNCHHSRKQRGASGAGRCSFERGQTASGKGANVQKSDFYLKKKRLITFFFLCEMTETVLI